MKMTDKILLTWFGAVTALMAGLAIAGGAISYSAVPFWDMWAGTVDFIIHVNEGDTAAWWRQHNEHRIILSRLLFWIDYKWFGGLSYFLIFVNYLLVGISAFVFWKILRVLAATRKAGNEEILLGLALSAWLFLWSQEENLTWGFQSQFFLAQLLPLCALFLLHLSTLDIQSNRYFGIACGLGVASAGTMANGILALPIMTIHALLTRQNPLRISILGCFSITSLFLYFYDYHAHPGHGTISQVLRENPFTLIEYVLLYLGSPFYFLFFKTEFGKYSALFMGIVLIGSSARFAIKSVFEEKKPSTSIALALSLYIFYIEGTALGTAGGRVIFGVDQALSSRYTTPVLMAWAALMALCYQTILPALKVRDWRYLSTYAVFTYLMLHVQLQAITSQDDILFTKKIAALALELQVNDPIQVEKIYPNILDVMPVAKKASLQNISVFGTYPYRDAREQLGKTIQKAALPPCQGNIESIEEIVGETHFVRVSGWIYDPIKKIVPQIIHFLNSETQVVGFAISGKNRPTQIDPISKHARLSGFKGYLLAGQTVTTIQGDNPYCQMQFNNPVQFFSHVSMPPSPANSTLSDINILSGNQWLGADFSKSAVNGMQIYGSYIKSDADVGSISLQVKRGDKVFYRSGPTGGHQILEIPGSGLSTVTLPISNEWSLLEFSSLSLPGGTFVIRLTDNGTGWGEWSAIAIKKNK